VSLALTASAIRPLAPVVAALEAVRGGSEVFGVADGLVVGDAPGDGWVPATELLTGAALDELLAAPRKLWGAKPHAAAALAYKQYTYWLAMPAVLGWAVARRVPLLDAGNVAVRLAADDHRVELGVRRPVVAVLPDDPAAGHPDAVVAAGEAELLAVLRDTLLDRHVAPLVAATRERVRIGAHTLYGQLAAGVTYVLTAASSPGVELVADPVAAGAALLEALGMTRLADLREAPEGGLCVRRSTCCLAFVVPGLGGRTCPDCCVTRD
jgi:ferric iron reductase protein FhuF